MSLKDGESLGPYQIQSAIGQGGMGEVYRVRDTKLGRDVAIKILPAEVTEDADKRTDIWAFGVVLYEMLTGQKLFSGETLSDTLAAILKTEPDWKKLPADVAQPVLSCSRPPRLHRNWTEALKPP